MTKSEAIANHRKLWHWIAKRTRELKRKVHKWEYFFFYNLGKIINDCYCCKYDVQLYVNSNFHFCRFCPINWGDGIGCMGDGSPYRKWRNCDPDDWERAAELADKIAELPERKDVEENNEKTEENNKTENEENNEKTEEKRRRTNYEENKD